MTFGCEAASRRIARLWITALDVGFVVLHEPRSREYFHRFVDTEQFLGFPVAWTDGAGNTIYRVPGWTGEQAVVVDEEQLRGIGPLRATNDPEFLERYVAWARGKRPARIHWTENGAAALQADARPGEAVLVKVNHESGWRVGGARVESDPIGFLLIRGAARGKVSLRYGATWDVWLGYAVFLGTVVLLAARVRTWRIAVAAMVPSLVAYAVLASQTPPQVAAAEQAYRRLQPPIINPGGIVDGATGKLPLVRGAIGSVFGVNFGASRSAKVIVDGREARVVYHGSNLFNFVVPEGAAPESTVTVDVNGCRGNSFVVPTRASP
jgi:hypothetical protein